MLRARLLPDCSVEVNQFRAGKKRYYLTLSHHHRTGQKHLQVVWALRFAVNIGAVVVFAEGCSPLPRLLHPRHALNAAKCSTMCRWGSNIKRGEV